MKNAGIKAIGLLLGLSALTATVARAASVTIEWDANTEGDLAGYRLFYAGSSLLSMTTAQAMSSASVTKLTSPGTGTSLLVNLADGTTYYFRLTAYNAAGEQSSFSTNPPEITTVTAPAATQPPNVPGNVTATAVSGTQVNLAWTYSGPVPTGFRVERSLNAGFSPVQVVTTLGHAARSFSATGLAAGTAYFFRVRAENAVGNSAFVSRSATTFPPGPGSVGGASIAPFSQKVLSPGVADGVNDAVDFGADAREVLVLDASGHAVFSRESAGRSSILWDGRDADGRPAAAGLYIGKIMGADGQTRFMKILLVK